MNTAEIVAHVRSGEKIANTLAIGPVVQAPAGTRLDTKWYFVVVSANDGEARFNACSADDRKLAEEMKLDVLAALIEVRPPLVLFYFDDELKLIEWCECSGHHKRHETCTFG